MAKKSMESYKITHKKIVGTKTAHATNALATRF
jgi:hypothetical protein